MGQMNGQWVRGLVSTVGTRESDRGVIRSPRDEERLLIRLFGGIKGRQMCIKGP